MVVNKLLFIFQELLNKTRYIIKTRAVLLDKIANKSVALGAEFNG
jgi:hypothetical protein